jgi:hypothetical protein
MRGDRKTAEHQMTSMGLRLALPRPYRRASLAAKEREALSKRWGDKLQKVEEEASHIFAALDR